MVPDGTWLGVELGGCGHKKAAARKDGPLEVRQKGVAERANAAHASGCRQAWLRHLPVKHLGRGIDSRHL
jgi:hypothetical protein